MPPTRHSMTEMHRSTNDSTGANIAAGQVPVANGSGGVTWDTVGGSVNGAYTVEPQTPHQSGHFLARDGTWRDPFIRGLGTVDSVGSVVSLIDNGGEYNAWPTWCRGIENTVLLAWTRATTHHADNTGRAMFQLLLEDGDGTLSAVGSPVTVYDHPSLWVSVMGIARISTGRIFMTLFRDDFSNADSGEAGMVWTDDPTGQTGWSDWISLSVGRDAEYGAGAVLELPDGDLLVPVEGHDVSGDDPLHNDSFVVRSTDQGESWPISVLVHDYDADSIPCYESCLVLLPDDTVQIYHRTGASAGSTVKRQESADFGATWGAMTDAWSGYGKANVIQDSTGVLWAVDRQTGTADVVLFASTDDGDTWDSGTVITTAPFEMEYGCPLESLRTGRLLVVWGDQPTSSTSNADIDYAIVVVDTAEFSSEPTGAAGGDLSGTYPNPSVVDDSHNHTATTLPAPEAGHEHMIDVFNGDASTTTFEISDQPEDAEQVFAFVAGSWTAVTVSGAMSTLVTFGSAPGSGTGNVVIQYPAAAA